MAIFSRWGGASRVGDRGSGRGRSNSTNHTSNERHDYQNLCHALLAIINIQTQTITIKPSAHALNKDP